MDTPTPADMMPDLPLVQIIRDLHGLSTAWSDTDVDDRNALTSKWRKLLAAPAPAVSGQPPTKLKMADIRVGMALRDPDDYYFQQSGVLTVTEITDRGFKYDAERGYSLGARYGFVEAKGREHFGLPDGECRYIPVPLPSAPVASAPKEERRIAQRRSEVNTPRSELGPERRAWKDRRRTDFIYLRPSARTVTRYYIDRDGQLYHVDSGAPAAVDDSYGVYLASEVDPLLTALAEAEADEQELRRLFDAFTEGQEASISKKPRESNPYPPGDSFAINLQWLQWEDGYDCNINRVLKLALAERAQEIERLRHHAYLMEQAANQQHGPCIAQIESGLARILTLTARAEAAEATVARLTAQAEEQG